MSPAYDDALRDARSPSAAAAPASAASGADS
jgi:hypothetical protein